MFLRTRATCVVASRRTARAADAFSSQLWVSPACRSSHCVRLLCLGGAAAAHHHHHLQFFSQQRQQWTQRRGAITNMPVTQRREKDVGVVESIEALAVRVKALREKLGPQGAPRIPHPLTLCLLVGALPSAPGMLQRLSSSSSNDAAAVPATLLTPFLERLQAHEDAKAAIAQLASSELMAWVYVFALHHRRLALDAAVAAGAPPKSNNDATPFDLIRWQQKFTRDVDETEAVFGVLAQLDDAVGMLCSDLAPAAGGSAELLDMVVEEAAALLGQLLTGGHPAAVEAVLARKLDEEDVVGRTTKTWILDVVGRAGGEEAAIFARELAEMYKNYAAAMDWRVEDVTDDAGDTGEGSEAEKGGTLAARLRFTGDTVYRYMRHELGTHRVQRVPVTEKAGKLQTSTASVFMMPVMQRGEVAVREEDCDIEMVRGSGPGGQGMQSSSNAVCLRHRPSGITVKCHQSRSGTTNKQIAMEIVAQKLWRQQIAASKQESARLFNSQWSTGERGEKMRTYNFPQNRVTDHVLGKNYTCTSFMEGGDALRSLHDAHNAKALRAALSGFVDKCIETGFSSSMTLAD